MNNGQLNHLELYRLPWTLSDNAISWLEPTAMCNLSCDGCYRENEQDSHLSVEEVKQLEREFFAGDKLDVFFYPYPEVFTILAYPSKSTLKSLGVECSTVDAIVTVK